MVKRALVTYAVDIDACVNWINTRDGAKIGATDVNVGTYRMLKLFAEHGIKASWYMPSCSIFLGLDTWMVPMKEHKPTKVVEIPGSWNVDDWPPMNYTRRPGTHGFVNPRGIEVQWRDHFDFFYREYETFVYVISCHPQVSGKSNVMLMHQRLIEYTKSKEGVEFVAIAQVCDEFKEGKLEGLRLRRGFLCKEGRVYFGDRLGPQWKQQLCLV
ncbi:uncharacterized protein BDV17DRAFT_290928 [Aspergillus undulatus]|uniref:uncharacterized protein n=1 Tax=Aspergillus undulatus TaxID=1810928 RepID=UPI003CCD1ADA